MSRRPAVENESRVRMFTRFWG